MTFVHFDEAMIHLMQFFGNMPLKYYIFGLSQGSVWQH